MRGAGIVASSLFFTAIIAQNGGVWCNDCCAETAESVVVVIRFDHSG